MRTKDEIYLGFGGSGAVGRGVLERDRAQEHRIQREGARRSKVVVVHRDEGIGLDLKEQEHGCNESAKDYNNQEDTDETGHYEQY